MKKIALFLLLAVVTFTVKSQEDCIIPTIGLNFSGMAFQNDIYNLNDHKMLKSGFIGGVRYQHQFKKPFIIETGVLYNESGLILNNLDELTEYLEFEYPLDKINYKFNYVSVPLMFSYRFGRIDRAFSVAPKIGVQFGYLVATKMKYVYAAQENKESFEFKTSNKFDVAEVAEIEFSWVWGKRVRSFLSIAQSYSFTNLNSGEEESPIINKDLIMHNFQFSANIGLRIKINKMKKSFFDD